VANEAGVKTPLNENVTLSDSELEAFKLSEAPESTEQPEGDKDPDEAKVAAEAEAKKAEAKEAAEAEAKKKEEEGEKDPDGKKKEAAEAEAAKKKEAEEEAEEEDPAVVEFAGKKYSQSDVGSLIKGNMLQTDYTQKTQELGELRAAMEPLVQFLDKLKATESKGIVEDLRATIIEEQGEDAGKLFDQALNFKPEDFAHPDAKKAKDLQAEVDQYRAKEAFVESQKTFVTDMKEKGIKVSRKEAAEVGQFTLDYFVKTQAAISLEDGYKLMKADGWRVEAEKTTAEAEKKAAAEKAKQGHESIPSKDKGASDILTEKKTPTTMDVSMAELKESGIKLFDD